MTTFIRYLLRPLGLFLLITSSTSAATLQTTLSSQFLARGETALLEIFVTEGLADEAMPTAPTVADVTIQESGFGNKPLRGGNRSGRAFQYLVSSYKEGRHVIPAISVVVDGVRVTTAPLDFVVFNPNELKWIEAVAGDVRIRYAAAFHVMKESPYENEAVPVEIKLYIPSELPVEECGIPEFQQDNVTCWRFEPSDTKGRINLLGRPYFAISYPSILSPTKPGNVGIGPATIRLMTIINNFVRREYVPVILEIPKLEMTAKKLPDGAPEGFANAVGRFSAIASTSQTEVRQGDPVSVEVEVAGTGNLDSLASPKLIDDTGWKTYESTVNPRGDERRLASGKVVFRQFLRPPALKTEVPAFRLVYFDPLLERYQTVLTEPIPLKVLPPFKDAATAATLIAPPQAAGIPVERMNDILGLIQPAQLLLPSSFTFPWWTPHLLGGLLALLLAGKSVWMRIRSKFVKDPQVIARRAALRSLERSDAPDHVTFLRKSGHFIEEWLGDKVSTAPALRAVLEERDASCYKLEPSAETQVNRQRRAEILSLLRKTAWLWISIAWISLGPESHAEPLAPAPLQSSATAAYDAADYDRAITLWLEAGPYDRLSADTLYNIGDACYRLGSPGHAALYYRRALERDSSHVEARQNLRFLERKYAPLTVSRPDYQYVLARLRLETWKNLVWIGSWMVGLGLLVFTATRAGAPTRIAAIIGFILGPILASVGALAWHFYPDDSHFAPVETQAIVVVENATLHTDAARNSPEVINAPPGSLCRLLKLSGVWAYVEFENKANGRGWIPTEQIERILPDSAPRPPKIEKPKAGGSSA